MDDVNCECFFGFLFSLVHDMPLGEVAIRIDILSHMKYGLPSVFAADSPQYISTNFL